MVKKGDLLFEVLAFDGEYGRFRVVGVVGKFGQKDCQSLFQDFLQVVGVVVKHRPFFVKLSAVPKHLANVP